MIKKYKILIISILSLLTILPLQAEENKNIKGKSPWEQEKNRVDINLQEVDNFKKQKKIEDLKTMKKEKFPRDFSQKLNNCQEKNKISEDPSLIINKSKKLTDLEQSFISCLTD